MKLWHEWRNWLHVRGLGKGWWELAGWAVAQRKPQRTDQALGRFHTYLPDMPAVTKSLPGIGWRHALGEEKKEKRKKQNPNQPFMGQTEGCKSSAFMRHRRHQDIAGLEFGLCLRSVRDSEAFGPIKQHYMIMQQHSQAEGEGKQNR